MSEIDMDRQRVERATGAVTAALATRGRPRKYTGKRPNWTIRLQEQYGAEVKRLAETSGRSISEVCESLISQALESGIGPHQGPPSFIVVTAPWQQDEELQATSICMEALKRVATDEGRQRVLSYLTSRTRGA